MSLPRLGDIVISRTVLLRAGAALAAVVLVGGLLVINANAATTAAYGFTITPVFSSPVAFDVSPPLRDLAAAAHHPASATAPTLDEDGNDDVDMDEGKPERDPEVEDDGFSGDGVRQATAGTAPIGPTLANFEGLSNQDNFDTFGFRVNPPDVSGDVGPNHYV